MDKDGQENRKAYKAGVFTYVQVIKMPVTLQKIYKEIEDVKTELHLIRHIMAEDYELSDEVLGELKKARDEMDNRGEFVTHEEIMSKYG